MHELCVKAIEDCSYRICKRNIPEGETIQQIYSEDRIYFIFNQLIDKSLLRNANNLMIEIKTKE